jgi:hypothetical protein
MDRGGDAWGPYWSFSIVMALCKNSFSNSESVCIKAEPVWCRIDANILFVEYQGKEEVVVSQE